MRKPTVLRRLVTLLLAMCLMLAAVPVMASENVTSLVIENGSGAHVYIDHNTYQLKLLAEIQGSSTSKDVTQSAYWASSNDDIIKVDKGLLKGVGKGSAVITAKYQGVTTSVTVQSDYLFKALKLSSAAALDLELGMKDIVIDAYAVEEDDSEFKVTEQVKWTSSNTNVATINKGKLDLLAAGTTTIKVQYKGLEQTVTVKVKSPYKSLKLEPGDVLEMQVGDASIQLKARAELPEGNLEDVTDEATWESSNPAAVKVDKGKIEPVGFGTATISVSYLGVSAELEVVVRLPYEAMVIEPKDELNFFITDAPKQITAEVLKGLTFRENVTSAAKWTSSNLLTATVHNGLVTPKAVGVTMIRAEYRGFVKEIPVVVYPTVTDIKAVKPEIDLFKKEVADLPVIVGKTLDGEEAELTALAEWESDNEKVLQVVDGKLEAKQPGKANLTVKIGHYTEVLRIQVREKVLDLQADQTEYQLVIDQSAKLPKVTALFEDGKREDITQKIEWEASSPNLLVKDGELTALLASKVNLVGTYLNKKITIPVVLEEEIVKFEIDPTPVFINPGKTQTLRVKGVYADGKSVTLTSKLEWISSNPEIAEVNGSRVKGLKEGIVELSTQFQGKPIQVKVEVVPKLLRLEVVDKSVEMVPGGTKDIKVIAVFDNGKSWEVTQQALWTSSKVTVATAENGKITAHNKGNATIKAAYNGKSVSIRVKVK